MCIRSTHAPCDTCGPTISHDDELPTWRCVPTQIVSAICLMKHNFMHFCASRKRSNPVLVVQGNLKLLCMQSTSHQVTLIKTFRHPICLLLARGATLAVLTCSCRTQCASQPKPVTTMSRLAECLQAVHTVLGIWHLHAGQCNVQKLHIAHMHAWHDDMITSKHAGNMQS